MDFVAGDACPIGSYVPNTKILFKGDSVRLREFFAESRGILFGGPGAFAPRCDHLLQFKDSYHLLRKKGIHFIGCLYTNDPYVLKAWARARDIHDSITLISDSCGRLAKQLGVLEKCWGFGFTITRFAMVIAPGGVVEWKAFGPQAYASNILGYLHASPIVRQSSLATDPAVRHKSDCNVCSCAVSTASGIKSNTYTPNDFPKLFQPNSFQVIDVQDNPPERSTDIFVSSCSGDDDDDVDEDEQDEEDDGIGTAADEIMTFNSSVFYRWRGLMVDASVRTDLLREKGLRRCYIGDGPDDIKLSYRRPSGQYEITHTPKAIRVGVDMRNFVEGFGSLEYRGKRYTAFEFHVVGPSPHMLDDKVGFKRPVEIRIIHTCHQEAQLEGRNADGARQYDFSAIGRPQMLVLAITLQPPCLTAAERDNVVASNSFINSVLNIPTLSSDTFEIFQVGKKAMGGNGFDLQKLISPEEGYICYNGVLSAMGEKVTWLVQLNSLLISRRQIEALEPYLNFGADVVDMPEDAYSLAYTFRYIPKLAALKCQSSSVLIDYIKKKTYVHFKLLHTIGMSAYKNMQTNEKKSIGLWLKALQQGLIEQEAEAEDLKQLIVRALAVFDVDDDALIQPLWNTETHEPSSLYLEEYLTKDESRVLLQQLHDGEPAKIAAENRYSYFSRANTLLNKSSSVSGTCIQSGPVTSASYVRGNMLDSTDDDCQDPPSKQKKPVHSVSSPVNFAHNRFSSTSTGTVILDDVDNDYSTFSSSPTSPPPVKKSVSRSTQSDSCAAGISSNSYTETSSQSFSSSGSSSCSCSDCNMTSSCSGSCCRHSTSGSSSSSSNSSGSSSSDNSSSGSSASESRSSGSSSTGSSSSSSRSSESSSSSSSRSGSSGKGSSGSCSSCKSNASSSSYSSTSYSLSHSSQTSSSRSLPSTSNSSVKESSSQESSSMSSVSSSCSCSSCRSSGSSCSCSSCAREVRRSSDAAVKMKSSSSNTSSKTSSSSLSVSKPSHRSKSSSSSGSSPSERRSSRSSRASSRSSGRVSKSSGASEADSQANYSVASDTSKSSRLPSSSSSNSSSDTTPPPRGMRSPLRSLNSMTEKFQPKFLRTGNNKVVLPPQPKRSALKGGRLKAADTLMVTKKGKHKSSPAEPRPPPDVASQEVVMSDGRSSTLKRKISPVMPTKVPKTPSVPTLTTVKSCMKRSAEKDDQSSTRSWSPREEGVTKGSRGARPRCSSMDEQLSARSQKNQDQLDLVDFMMKQLKRTEKDAHIQHDAATTDNTQVNQGSARLTLEDIRHMYRRQQQSVAKTTSNNSRTIKFAEAKPEENVAVEDKIWDQRKTGRELRLRNRKPTAHPTAAVTTALDNPRLALAETVLPEPGSGGYGRNRNRIMSMKTPTIRTDDLLCQLGMV